MKRFALILLFAALSVFGQTPNAVKVTKLILGVADLDRSVAFYRALGLRTEGQVGQPQGLPDLLLKLVDVPKGTRFRNAVMKFPGGDFELELTEFSAMELHPSGPRIQDPGATLLIAQVRNVGAVLARVKSAGATVVTPGGAPIRNERGKSLVAAVRDPDGFFVAIVKPDALPSGDDSFVISARWATTVQDADANERYLGSLGFDTKLTDWDGNDPVLTVLAVDGSQYRSRGAELPDSSVRLSFYQWRNIDRKPARRRIPDPGAPAIGLQVRDLEAAETAIKAAGGSVITQGGSVQVPGGGKIAFVRDPGGVLIELSQPK
jgi:catechol 2,3-dioxygenase-like lactoylglutathione lyase family enzyme